jgi:hypothetical protein
MADVKISQLPVATDVTPDDLLVLVDDPTGSPITKNVSVSVLKNPSVVQLAYSSTLNTDANTGDIFDVTLTGAVTLANPSNPIDGKTIRWRIKQDGSGNRVVTLGNKFNIPSSASSPLPFSTTGNKTDLLAATYNLASDKWDVIAFVPGY